MEELVAGGRIVHLMLAFMLIEALAHLAYRRWSKRGLGAIDVLLALLPGLCLLLALRDALTGQHWTSIALWLAALLLAHLADLWRRQTG